MKAYIDIHCIYHSRWICSGCFCSQVDFGGKRCLCHWSISAQSQAATTCRDRTCQERGTLLYGAVQSLRLSGKLGSVVDTDPFERYFTYSGLPKMVLKQICIESGILPDCQIDFNRFAQCCRMIAHCKAQWCVVIWQSFGPWKMAAMDYRGCCGRTGEGAIHASQLCDSLWPSCLPNIPLLQSNGGRRLSLCIAWALGSSWYLDWCHWQSSQKDDILRFQGSLLLWKCCFTAVPNVRTKRWRLCQLVTCSVSGRIFCCFNVWRWSCDMW